MARFRLTDKEKRVVDRMVKKSLAERLRRKAGIATISFDEVDRLLSAPERLVAAKFIDIDARTYGVLEPFASLEDPPDNLVRIRNQKYVSVHDGKQKTLTTQYLSKPAFRAYQKLSLGMRAEIGKSLHILSGYRSPAYQLLVFMRHFAESQYRVSRATKRVGLPGFSQHGDPKHHAIDFMTADGTYDVTFRKSEEYIWLQRNAKKFGFTESYPKNNRWGVSYEPWHWRFTG